MKNSLGICLLLELRDCNPEIIRNLDKVTEIMVTAAKTAKATVVEVAFHEFNPFGISGMVIIAESHLAIHTWPEYNYAAVEIFTCGHLIKPEVAAQYLIEKFESKNPVARPTIEMGIGYGPHKPETKEMTDVS